MKRWSSRWVWLGVAALLAFLGLRIGRLLAAPSPTKPRADDLAAASREVRPAEGVDRREPLGPPGTIGANGVIEPRERETRVGTAVAGRVLEVRAVEGSWVEHGEVLVVFESAVEQASLDVARAERAAAEAALRRALRGSRAEEIRAALAEAEQAGARAALATSVLARSQQLGRSGAISADEVERAKAQSLVDDAAARAAAARSDAVTAGPRPEERAQARAQLEAAIARERQAEATLERLTLRAPERGQVLQVRARAGEYLQPGGEPLVVLGDTSQLVARVDVDEHDLAGLSLGAGATVRASAWPGREIRGEIAEIGHRMGRKNVRSDDPVERNDTKILEVLVILEDDRGLVVGQRVTAYLERAVDAPSPRGAIAHETSPIGKAPAEAPPAT